MRGVIAVTRNRKEVREMIGVTSEEELKRKYKEEKRMQLRSYERI